MDVEDDVIGVHELPPGSPQRTTIETRPGVGVHHTRPGPSPAPPGYGREPATRRTRPRTGERPLAPDLASHL